MSSPNVLGHQHLKYQFLYKIVWLLGDILNIDIQQKREGSILVLYYCVCILLAHFLILKYKESRHFKIICNKKWALVDVFKLLFHLKHINQYCTMKDSLSIWVGSWPALVQGSFMRIFYTSLNDHNINDDICAWGCHPYRFRWHKSSLLPVPMERLVQVCALA